MVRDDETAAVCVGAHACVHHSEWTGECGGGWGDGGCGVPTAADCRLSVAATTAPLRVGSIVAYINVRHTLADSRFNDIKVGAPLERASSVDHQVSSLDERLMMQQRRRRAPGEM